MRLAEILELLVCEDESAIKKAADANIKRAKAQKTNAEIAQLRKRLADKQKKLSDLMRA